jgi:hypothetical protein
MEGMYAIPASYYIVPAHAIVVGAAILKAAIQDTRDMLANMGVKIPIGNSDAGSYFNREVLSSVDYGVRLYLGCPLHGSHGFVVAVQRARVVCEYDC